MAALFNMHTIDAINPPGTVTAKKNFIHDLLFS